MFLVVDKTSAMRAEEVFSRFDRGSIGLKICVKVLLSSEKTKKNSNKFECFFDFLKSYIFSKKMGIFLFYRLQCPGLKWFPSR